MCSFKRIAVSNRRLCPRPLPCQAERLRGRVDMLILREKDMPEAEYRKLAIRMKRACQAAGILLVCHTFIDAAKEAACPRIHLPVSLFVKAKSEGRLEGFQLAGASIHTLEEGLMARQYGAHYVIAGNIFETACKKGLEGKGTGFLQNLCQNLDIPVYGLGGITDNNESRIKQTGAAGACRMSGYMEI